MPSYVLVHSPLVGPATWDPVAAELRRHGHPVVVPGLTPAAYLRPPYLRAATMEAVGAVRGSGHAGEDAVVLAGHSGAGPRLPTIALALTNAGFPVVATIFVDAGLPLDGRTPREAAPPAFTDLLRDLAGADGRLPPWSQWWGPDALAELIPDDGVRARIEAELTTVPAALFDEPVPTPPGWRGEACAYVCFTYEDEAAAAEQRGWPTRRLGGHHLHLVTHPAEVATALVDLTSAVR